MFWTDDLKTKVRDAEQRTYELLRELGEGKYKTIKDLTFVEEEGTANCCQVGGQLGQHLNVSIFAGDPVKKVWAVAHELGHGVHELYRGSNDHCGESWAEAIRYFAEQRYNPGSEWLKNGPPSQDRIILDACGWNWDKFKDKFHRYLLLK